MMSSMGERLSLRLVPDRLWEMVASLLPEFTPRRQGGGRGPLDSRSVFTAVVYVLSSECAWRRLPSSFAVSPATAHRRFVAWSEAGLWERMRQVVLEGEGADDEKQWALSIAEAAMSR